jgi:hypothetical protein
LLTQCRRSFLAWRQPAQATLTPHVFAALTHALEALNVRCRRCVVRLR